jgi:predicted DsbA family dithiol-disulfide isomerase
MGEEGQDINEHISEKYGLTDKQMEDNKQNIKAMGKQAGFDMAFQKRARIYNTLDCHILLHFAQEKGKQTELKLALFKAYFTDGKNVSDRAILIEAVESVGLDKQEAEVALDSEHYKKTVKEEESKFKSMGISSVPAFIINNKYLLSGGQPVENFIQSLTEIADKEA